MTPLLSSGPLNANVGGIAQIFRYFPGISGANQDVADLPRQGQFGLSVGLTLGVEDVGVGQEVVHVHSLIKLNLRTVPGF